MPQPILSPRPAQGGAPPGRRRIPSCVVLAGMRVALALLFVVWLALAPPGSLPDRQPVIALFGAYLVAAVGMAGVAWHSWWLDHRLAAPRFVIDVLTALAGLYLTRAVMLDFFSAFMAFFAFLMLTSAARWSGRSMLLIVIGLAVCFLLVGWLVQEGDQFFHMTKFIRRFSTLVVLLAMLGWFARNRRGVSAERYHRQGEDEALDGALAYAMTAMGAVGGAIAWVAQGETQAQVASAGTAQPPRSIPKLPNDDLAALSV